MDAEDESWLRDLIMREEARESESGAESESEFLDVFHQLAGQAQRPGNAAGWNPSGEMAARATLRFNRERVDADMAAAGCKRESPPAAYVASTPAAATAAAAPSAARGSQQPEDRAKRLEDLMALLPLACVHANGIEELLEKALDCDALHFNLLKPGALEGKVQENAVRWLSQTAAVPFKVGITTDPFHRWANDEYGYMTNSVNNVLYRRMVILYVSSDATAVGMLEAALITVGRLMYPGRCMNIASGGEAKKKAQTHFAYIVFG
jgi:hypothetical protein